MTFQLNRSITTLLMLLSTYCIAQNKEIQVSSYFGTYAMRDLKNFQKDNESQLPYNTISNLPGYWGYELNYGLKFDSLNTLSLYAGLNSTGGRSHYADYSGESKLDLRLLGIYFGMEYLRKYNNSSAFDILLGGRAGVTFTTFNLKSRIIVGAFSSIQDVKFVSTNIHLGPTLAVKKSHSKFYGMVFTRFEFNIQGKLKYSEYKKAYLVHNHEAVKADWTGLRFGVAIGMRIK